MVIRLMFAAVASWLLASPALATPRLFTSVTVVDAVSGPRPGLDVLTDEGEIRAVGVALEPHGAEVIDGRGAWLIPGLWDLHVHLGLRSRVRQAMLDLFIGWGVTSVRDMGGPLRRLQRLKDVAEERGVSVYFSGPMLEGRRALFDGMRIGYPRLGRRLPSPEAAARAVDELAAAGVDFIKVYELVEADMFEAIVARARHHGLPLAAHIPLALPYGSVASAVNSLEHLRNLEYACPRSARELLARRRVLAAKAWPVTRVQSIVNDAQRKTALADFDAEQCSALLTATPELLHVPTLRYSNFYAGAPVRCG